MTDHNVVDNEQVPAIAQDPLQHVTTILICQKSLLRSGISHILLGTRFVAAHDEFGFSSSIPAFAGNASVLFLVCGSRSPDECVETVERLKTGYPSARVVILADQMEPQAAVPLLQAGLDGLCSTSMERNALIKALELIMLGETFVSSSFSVALLEQGSLQPLSQAKFVSSVPANDFAAAHKLSAREAEILHCLTQGASNKLIARELGVAEATVKVHIKAILRKVKAANRKQAAMWAQERMNSGSTDRMMTAAE